MSKIIQFEITGCHICPFREYDSHYNIGRDSGYDCTHIKGKGRIFDDSELKKALDAGLLNPLQGFPDWCPLEDAKMGFYSVEIPRKEIW